MSLDKMNLRTYNFIAMTVVFFFGKLFFTEWVLFTILVGVMLIFAALIWALPCMATEKFDRFINLYLFDYNHKVAPFFIFQLTVLLGALIPPDFGGENVILNRLGFLPPLAFLFITEKQRKKQQEQKIKCSDKPVYIPFSERDRLKGFPFLEEEIAGRRKPLKKPARVLVIRGGEIGDILFTTAVVRNLRERFTKIHITYLTRMPEVLAGNNYINEVLDFKDPLEWYSHLILSDWVLDYRGAIETTICADKKKSLIPALAEMYWVPLQFGAKMQYRMIPGEKNWAKDVLLANKLSNPRTIIICGEAGSPTRTWPEAYVFELAQMFIEKNYQVMLMGSKPGTPAPSNIVDLRGKTTYRQAVALISVGRLFIGVDSGLLYSAIAIEAPAIGIFSVLDPDYMPVQGNDIKVITPKDVPCAPCYDYANVCKNAEQMACMNSITPERVMKTALEELEKWMERAPIS